MEIMVDLPGGSRVDAHFDAFTVQTDQPVALGGDNSAPSPFEVFLASLATCAGFYVLRFCKSRGIASEGIRLIQKTEHDPDNKMTSKISLDIQLPEGFPEQYFSAVIRAAESCLVKKHLENPPAFEIRTSIVSASST
jgi:putative redox protein